MIGLMGRRRKSNLNLPPHMHMKGKRYYYVTNDKPRKWIPLGDDLHEARKKWAELENGPSDSDSISRLIDEWLEIPNELTESTMLNYRSVAKQLKEVFGNTQVALIRPHHVASWLDNHASKARANLGKAVLTNALDLAIRRGMIDRNPAREIQRINVKRRKRYLTDQEYIAIRSNAHPVLKSAMDISLLTGARISDVLAIQMKHWSEDGLLVRQIKTNKLQLFKRNSALESVINAARRIPRPVRGMYLLCTLKGQRYSKATLYTWWVQACELAKVEDANFHDIRGKAATDAKREGLDYQALLGHSTKAMSDRYIKLEDAQVVEPRQNVL